MGSSMQQMMGYIRKAVTDYQMLSDGDKVAVGVSGGKDSVVLLAGLAGVRRYLGVDFQLEAVTLDNGFAGTPMDYSPLQELCRQLGVGYTLKRTEIGSIIFDVRQEENPCSLCARMRRGCLHDTAKALGCNKIALGHHFDDAVETFMMNLFNEGRIGCFSPVTYLSRKDVTVIRPLIYAPEKEIRSAQRKAGLPVVKSACPVDGCTNRQWTKEFLAKMEKEHKGITNRIFGAMKRGHISGW
ncbi:tRNA 2-thiocytidine biosynthesis TtcA family protein [Youxingia wuxianensis]